MERKGRRVDIHRLCGVIEGPSQVFQSMKERARVLEGVRANGEVRRESRPEAHKLKGVSEK